MNGRMAVAARYALAFFGPSQVNGACKWLMLRLLVDLEVLEHGHLRLETPAGSRSQTRHAQMQPHGWPPSVQHLNSHSLTPSAPTQPAAHGQRRMTGRTTAMFNNHTPLSEGAAVAALEAKVCKQQTAAVVNPPCPAAQ